MVTRVSTTGNYSSVLANLMAAQLRQADANERVSTQKNGKDLKDYAKKAETLAAMRVVERRTKAYQDQNHLIADKLTNQDQALNQVTDSAAQIRRRSPTHSHRPRGHADDRPERLFKSAVEGMNTSYDGKYLFAGGQINTQPVTAHLARRSDVRPGDRQLLPERRLQGPGEGGRRHDGHHGLLADDLGTNMMNALKTLQTFHEGGAGPFSGSSPTPSGPSCRASWPAGTRSAAT
jgi:flagellar hook-associated protein 3 FlgL